MDEQIQSALQPYYQELAECISLGWKEFNQNEHYNNNQHIYTKRTKANIVRDHIVDKARNRFSDRINEGIFISEKADGLFCVVITVIVNNTRKVISLRFKKLNKQYLSSNIVTKQALRYNTQIPIDLSPQIQLPLPGFEEVRPIVAPQKSNINLNVGYLLNDINTDIENVLITKPDGSRSTAWYISITESPSQGNTIINLPIVEIEETPRKRVRAKGQKNNQLKKASNNETNS